ncbi:MAG: hypothetical protein HQK51_16235 [Oligoflexia bacterium]|nr:hypothetical protein [Oligoflexia bacterium]
MIENGVNQHILNFACINRLTSKFKLIQILNSFRQILTYTKNFKLKNIFHTSILPIVLCISILATFMVFCRMKRIESDYKYYEINKDIEVSQYENKELHAYKAKLMSVKNLNGLAKKYQMERPKEKQIIVIKGTGV